MIQDDIINELQFLPEQQLQEVYAIIHALRLSLNNNCAVHAAPKTLAGCLQAFADAAITPEQAKQQAWDAAIHEKYPCP